VWGLAEGMAGRRGGGEGGVKSIADGGENMVRPRQGAGSPNKAIRKAQGRGGAQHGGSHLRTPRSILMCYRDRRGRLDNGASTAPICRFADQARPRILQM